MRDILIVTGLTGAGKSLLSVEYAQNFRNAHIINADASQLYNELKILTAFPSESAQNKVPHHLFGILSPQEKTSVAEWMNLADDTVNSLPNDANIIICGGTGFYIDAFLHGIAEIPPVPRDFRAKVQQKFQQLGSVAFYKELLKLDPDTNLHPNNTQRILRAYEVAAFTGKTLRHWWNCQPKRNIRAKILVILPSRDVLRSLCEVRIMRMLDNGLIDEICDFSKRYPNYSGGLCSAIGYKEAVLLSRSKISKNEFLNLVLTRTVQYAKRQSTWFRNRFPDAHFVENLNSGKFLLTQKY